MRKFIETECDATFLMKAHWRGVDLHNPETVNGVMDCCKKKIYEVEKGIPDCLKDIAQKK